MEGTCGSYCRTRYLSDDRSFYVSVNGNTTNQVWGEGGIILLCFYDHEIKFTAGYIFTGYLAMADVEEFKRLIRNHHNYIVSVLDI